MASCSLNIMQIGFAFAELKDAWKFEPVAERKKALDCPTSTFMSYFVMIFSSLPSYMVTINCGSYDDILLNF